jgi:hypothetical protein
MKMNLLTLIGARLVFAICGCTNSKLVDNITISDTLSGQKLIGCLLPIQY